MRDHEPEQQAEADDVQTEDRGGKAARAHPLGRAERAAGARDHPSPFAAHAGHRPASGKWVKRAR